MHAKALEIAWHDDSPIWSVDISCDNRVVTASGDKVARLWRFHPNPHSALSSFATTPREANSPSDDCGPRASTPPKSSATSTNPTPSKQSLKLSRLSSIKLDATLVEWLCDLRAHATTINIARFSPDGLSVATAADHGEIVIWRLNLAPVEISPLSAAVHDDDAPKERWQIDVTLRGHLQDVLDLAWSLDSSKLVSASVDNTVMIWDLRNPTKMPITLRNHSNFVQGIAIDPLSRLVASMGNDRCLRVFTSNSSTWCQVTSVSSLGPDSRLFLDDSQFNSFFRRLSWSPDGSILACPSGVHLPREPKKRLFAVHIFARNQWNAPILQCGGLVTPASAVRFSPILYHLRNPPKPTPSPTSPTTVASKSSQAPFRLFTYRMVFAVACAHIILFYDTEHLTRPFASVEGLHCAEHTDITWSADGRTLLVSAVDGYISVISFSEEELGRPLSQAEMPPWLNRCEEVAVKANSALKGQKVVSTIAPTTVVRPRHADLPAVSQVVSAVNAVTITPTKTVPSSAVTATMSKANTPGFKEQSTTGTSSTGLTKQCRLPKPTSIDRGPTGDSLNFASPKPPFANQNHVSLTKTDVRQRVPGLSNQAQHEVANLIKPAGPESILEGGTSCTEHCKTPLPNLSLGGTPEGPATGWGIPGSAKLQAPGSMDQDVTAVDVMDVEGPTSPSDAEGVVFVSGTPRTKQPRPDDQQRSAVEPSPAKKQKVTPGSASKRRGKSKVQTKFCFLPAPNNAAPVVGLAVTPGVTNKHISHSIPPSPDDPPNSNKTNDEVCSSSPKSADHDVEMTHCALP